VKKIDYNGTETIFSTVVNTGIQNEDIVVLLGNPNTSSPVYIQTNNNFDLPYNVEVYTIT
jgi:hypothetical protein